MHRGRRLASGLALLLLAAAWSPGTRADTGLDCFGEDADRRIEACTALIERGGATLDEIAHAYAMRALAFSLKGRYDRAITDYDRAIDLIPDYAVALNNRAWAYFRWGKAAQGLPDVEKSLMLSPTSSHAYDTRAHIRQTFGQSRAALADYEQAMRFGGERMIKLYQCGLAEAGLYKGELDGVWRRDLQDALEACVTSTTCDPLPADEFCRAATS